MFNKRVHLLVKRILRLIDVSTGYVSWGRGGRRVGLTALPPSYADSLEILRLNVMQSYGTVQACNGITLPYLRT
jgi:hypothetical protein